MAVDIEHELGTTDVTDTPKRIVVLEFNYIDGLASVGVSPVGIADDNKREMEARFTAHKATMAAFNAKVETRAAGLTAHFGVTGTDAL